MKQSTWLWLIFIVTAVFWVLVGYRVIRPYSPWPGAVTINWATTSTHPWLKWTPNRAAYSFQDNQLQIQPGGQAQLLVSPPTRYRQGIISLPGGGDIRIMAGAKNSWQADYTGANELKVNWRDLGRIAGGYRLTLTNLSDTVVRLGTIKLQLLP